MKQNGSWFLSPLLLFSSPPASQPALPPPLSCRARTLAASAPKLSGSFSAKSDKILRLSAMFSAFSPAMKVEYVS